MTNSKDIQKEDFILPPEKRRHVVELHITAIFDEPKDEGSVFIAISDGIKMLDPNANTLGGPPGEQVNKEMFEKIKELEKQKDVHAREVSKLMKDLNRACKMADAYNKANESRKDQISLWNSFFQKLLAEGRITKAELKEYSPPKARQK